MIADENVMVLAHLSLDTKAGMAFKVGDRVQCEFGLLPLFPARPAPKGARWQLVRWPQAVAFHRY